MVLMLVDHARDILTDLSIYPTDLTKTYPALFFTRWMTHFCAPTFVFLSGLACYFQATRTPPAQLRPFLLKRGAMLIVMELTVIQGAWALLFNERMCMLQVIWAIGWCMILLALLIRVPAAVIGLVGVAIVAGHNLLDGIHAADFGGWGALWAVVHERVKYDLPFDYTLMTAYPVLPWFGVMACGYGFGTLYKRVSPALCGLGLVIAFIGLRALNLYGDPTPWVEQATPMFSLLAYLNCQKYPPSLLYVLMTIGPALMALELFDRVPPNALTRPLQVIGRVPLFYYILHLYLLGLTRILLLAIGWEPPPGVAAAYLGSAVLLPILYLACRAYDRVKIANPQPWMRYI